MLDPQSILEARTIARTYGKGYYRATSFFPKAQREATWVLYAFFRLPDQIVDEEHDTERALAQLDSWRRQWSALVSGQVAQNVHPILIAAHYVHEKYRIPYHYSEVFLACMAQDLTVARYKTYTSLEDYMYGSASVVGIMMSYIIGFADGALPYAKALGEAMQLTNFLRDVDEDYVERGRVYLPQEDMAIYGVTEGHIEMRIVDDQWVALMRYEIARARVLFREGNKGIPLLHSRGRRAVAVASVLYEGILDTIEKNGYDVFRQRARTSRLGKLRRIMQTLLWNKNQ